LTAISSFNLVLWLCSGRSSAFIHLFLQCCELFLFLFSKIVSLSLNHSLDMKTLPLRERTSPLQTAPFVSKNPNNLVRRLWLFRHDQGQPDLKTFVVKFKAGLGTEARSATIGSSGCADRWGA
jgi:hypothetical protein